MSTLSSQSLKTINDYLHLPIGGVFVNCPYYNNRRAGMRAGLRVLIGKGSAEDIVEEAMLIALREKIDLKKLDATGLKKFLVDSHLGIDCSGLAYHLLDAELKSRGLGGLNKHLKFPFIKNPFRKLLTLFRPVESAGVRTISHEQNSVEVKLSDVKPGDLIAILGTGEKQDRNHVLIIHKVTGVPSPFEGEGLPAGKGEVVIHYTHSMQWPSDGQYNHGVRQSEIEIIDKNKNILEQIWFEPEALNYARGAKEVKICRLKAM